MLRLFVKLLKVLNSEAEPFQVSLAFCFAMVAGLTPILSLHNIIVLLLVLLLRVNLSGFILGLLVFSGIAYILDPIFHIMGLALLNAGALKGIWSSMYSSTLWRLENFNNTIVMGSLVFSAVLFIPLYFMLNMLINKYRANILEWINKSRFMQAIKASRFYSIYHSVSDWRTGA